MQAPEWLDAELWETWIDYRRQDKKKPASERSQQMTINKLARLMQQGYDPHLLLETAIEREWQGIYATEECRYETDRKLDQPKNLSAVERVRAANARHVNGLRVVGAND